MTDMVGDRSRIAARRAEMEAAAARSERVDELIEAAKAAVARSAELGATAVAWRSNARLLAAVSDTTAVTPANAVAVLTATKPVVQDAIRALDDVLALLVHVATVQVAELQLLGSLLPGLSDLLDD